MSSTDRPRRVLVAVDFTEMCELAVERAYLLVKDEADAELAAVTVAMPDGAAVALDLGDGIRRATEEEALELVREWMDERLDALGVMQSVGPRSLAVYLATGDPVIEIVRVATHIEADLVVLGTHGRQGLKRLILGSVAEGVLRQAPCDVWVAREHESDEEAGDAASSAPGAPRIHRLFSR